MELMVFAGLLFLGTHLGISSTGLRNRLVSLVGERGFQALFSLIALIALSYLIWLYGELPRWDYLWLPSPELYLVTKILMPVALVFAAGGILPGDLGNRASARGEGMSGSGGEDLARGMTRITRHPFQWGVAIWAFAHLVSNGDSVSVVFFTTFALLSLIGTVAIDRKQAARRGADWASYAEVTSNVPLLAVLQGRNRLVARELMVAVIAGLVGYGIIFRAHQWIGGVRIL